MKTEMIFRAGVTASALLCGMSAPVWAQSTATLGGFIKAGVDSTRTTGTTNPVGDRGRVTRVSDNTSFWYLEEDLGGNASPVLPNLSAGAGSRMFHVGIKHTF